MTELTQNANAALLKEFSLKARSLRIKSGLTQGEAAVIAGCSRQTYSDFERGHDCSASTLIGILRAIGKSNEFNALLNTSEPSISQRKRAGHSKKKLEW